MSAKKKVKTSVDPIYLCETMAPHEILRLVGTSEIQHLVQRDSLVFDQELRAAQHMQNKPADFLHKPLETIFGSSAKRTSFYRKVQVGEKKADILSAFGDYMNQVQGVRTVWDNAFLCADEIFTNGAKNAWSKSTKVFSGPISYPGQIELFAEADDKRMIIGCRDSYGHLRVREVLERMLKCYDDGVAQSIRHGLGGAGIGSFLIFEACLSYYAGVEPGKQSVVCVAFPLGVNRRAAAAFPKNIHLLGK